MNQQISNQRCPTQMWKPLLWRCKLQKYVTGPVCGEAGWQTLPGTAYEREGGSEEGMRSVPGWATARGAGLQRDCETMKPCTVVIQGQALVRTKACSTTWTMWDASNYSTAALECSCPSVTATQWWKHLLEWPLQPTQLWGFPAPRKAGVLSHPLPCAGSGPSWAEKVLRPYGFLVPEGWWAQGTKIFHGLL